MFHLVKSKSKTKHFSVIETAENGEVLSSHGLKTKQACFKNLVARMDNIFCDDTGDGIMYIEVQDETSGRVALYLLFDDGKKSLQSNIRPRYVPGRNPKKK